MGSGRSAWTALPAPVTLMFAGGVAVYGLRVLPLVALTTWLVLWLFLRKLVKTEGSRYMYLEPFLLLAGVALALTADVGRFLHARNWLLLQLTLTVVGSTGIGCAIWASRRWPHWSRYFCDSTGMRVATGLCVLSLVAAAVPALRQGVWVPASLAYLLGTSIVVARRAELGVFARNLTQIAYHHRFTFAAAALPTAVLLSPVGRLSDFSPALLLIVALVAMLAAAGEKRAALAVAGVVALTLIAAYHAGIPSRFVERVDVMLCPSRAHNDQVIGTLWAMARGGLLGSPFHMTLANGAQAWGNAELSQARPAVYLPLTDAVWAALGETGGVAMVLAVLGVCAACGVCLWRSVTRENDLTRRCFATGTFVLFGMQAFCSAAWVTRASVVMGLSTPILAVGVWSACFWTILIANSAATTEQASAIASRRQTEKPSIAVPAAMALLALIIATGAVKTAVTDREKTLATVFSDLGQETEAWTSIRAGMVVPDANGQAYICEKNLPAAEPQRTHKQRQLQRFLHSGVYVSRRGSLAVDAAAFRQSEPSGLGTIIRLTEAKQE